MALLSDEQSQTFRFNLRSDLDQQPWWRWMPRLKFPFEKLWSEGAQALGPDRRELKRRFWIVKKSQ